MNPASLLPGTEIGPWRVVARRGQGSYGVVYGVQRTGHAESGLFALKLALHPLDPRFEREGELLSRLQHPQVPRLQDRGWWVLPGGVPFPYLVMEWVEGAPLYEWAAQHPLTSGQALRLLAQVARALEATHAVEGVHRDVKGDNVLVREDGSAVLMDFGSGDYRGARTLTHQPPPPGTPQYQSPESLRFQWQWRASRTARYEASPADDLYALGVMAYRLVTGRYPPPAVDLEETEEGARFVVLPRVPPESLEALEPELGRLIHQLLAPEPSARGSAAEVAQALEAAARSAARTSSPAQRRAWARSRWLAAAVSVCLALGVGWFSHRLSRQKSPETVSKEETVGLAEAAQSAPVGEAPPGPTRAGVGLDLPKQPLPGQHRPPCAKYAVEINGGCWGRLSDATPPCGTHAYAWKNGCYVPMLDPQRPPTSGQP